LPHPVEDKDLDSKNLRSMLKISNADCCDFSPAISSQFTVEMCFAAKIAKQFTKTPLLGV